MTIDVHTHLGPDRFSYSSVTSENLSKHVDDLIEHMDKYNITCAVLTSPSIDMTDLYREAALLHPDRFFYAASIPLRPLKSTMDKLDALTETGCRAIVLDNDNLCDLGPSAFAVVHEAIERGFTIYMHFHDFTYSILSFLDQVSLLYPAGRFVVLHMGGLFGFHNILPLLSRGNIWLETSVTLIKLVESPVRVFLDALLQDAGIRYLAFGSEHYTDYSDLLAILNLLNLNVETNREILEANANSLLNL